MNIHIGAIGALALLSACASVLPDPPPAPLLYPLEAAQEAAPATARRDRGVAEVTVPNGPDALRGSRIVWRRDGVLASMSGAAWPGRADELLQGLLAEPSSRRGAFAAGVRSGGDAAGDVDIYWDLIAFEIIEEGAGLSARFSAHARIVAPRTRALIASEIVDVSTPFADRRASVAARALAQSARIGAARIADLAASAAPTR